MPKYSSSIEIAGTAAEVWHVLADVNSWPHWLPTVTAVFAQTEQKIQIGNRYAVHQPRLRPAVYEVTELRENQRFIWETRAPGIRTIADHIIERIGDNKVRVILSVDIRGALGSMLGFLAGGLTKNYLQQETQALKKTVERTG
ncbi:MAG: SRPBCC family protein [Leptospiraceae bacterium]|nr:SRPBCC family protein [Leptospiraceae bacterium]